MQPSIRLLVIALFSATMLVAFTLLAAFENAVSSYYRGESTILTRLFQPAQPIARTSRTSMVVLRMFNAALLEGPDAPTDPAFLAKVTARASPLGIALRIGDRIVYESPALDEATRASLPLFGAPGTDEPITEESKSIRTMHQFDFRTGSGLPATFFILHRPNPATDRLPFSRQIFFVVALLLLAAESIAGAYFILRLTSSMRRVEAAALAMSRGDLATPIEGGYKILELARVFDALETMRSEISVLLAREREQEVGRRELIANLSHDLRTPLSAIRGYVDGLREGIADNPEKVAHYLEVAGKKIHDLDRMIGQIFLLSTLDARESPPDLRRMDLSAFLRDSVEELRLSLPHGSAELVDEGLTGVECPVLADPLQLRRVIENLVDNAVRHGGRVPVRILVGLSMEGNAAVFRVDDDGKGIPPEKASLVFERFYRGDSSRTGAGMGLGLAIVKQIVDAHAGSIVAGRSAMGGASFVISLPLREG
jgi:signal transduction histidine kinase